MGRNATIDASALITGNGGKVIVWADDATRFYGSIFAKGGAQGGDGGFVEVSGKQSLLFKGSVDTRAPQGRTGTLLLDPLNITISDAASTGTMNNNADTPVVGTNTFADTTASTSNLNTGILETQLGLSNVIVDTTSALVGPTGTITVQDCRGVESVRIPPYAQCDVEHHRQHARCRTSTPLSITNVGSGGINFNAGAFVNVDGSVSTAGAVSVTAPGGFTQGVNSTISTGTGLSVDAGAASFAFGVIAGTGGLTKQGASDLTLAKANTYSGTTTISAGTLRVGQGVTTGTLGTGAVTNNAALVFNRSNSYTVSNAISGTGTLEQAGTGTLTLSGANTYDGNTVISAGTLQLGAANVIPHGPGKGNVSVASGATLDLNTFSETINGLTGAGTVDTVAGGTPTLTVGDENASGAFSGVIQDTAGTLSLTKISGGTLTLSGANTYAGATLVSGGTLEIQNDSGLGTTGAGTTVDPSAILQLTGVNVGNEAITLAGGTLNNSGTSTLLGGVTLTADSFVGGSGSLTLNGTVGGAFDLEINTSGGGSLAFANDVTLGSLTPNFGTYDLALTGATNTIGGLTLFTHTGLLTLGDAVGDSTTFTGGMSVSGTVSEVRTGGTISTAGANLMTISGSPLRATANTTLATPGSVLTLQNVTINDGVTLTLGNADATQIALNGAVNGVGGGVASNLTVNSTASGFVLNSVGNDIGTVTVTNSNGFQFAGTVDAATVTLTASGGTIQFQDNLTVTSGLTTTGSVNNIAITGGLNSIAGTTSFTNAGSLTLGQALGSTTFVGGLTRAGSSTLNGTISTTDSPISLGAVSLNSDTTLNTNATRQQRASGLAQ